MIPWCASGRSEDRRRGPRTSRESSRGGSAELLILSLLERNERHGYEVAKLIEGRSGGRLSFHASSLYPVLFRMEKRGWIKGTWVEKEGERRRRFYRLTEKGERALAAQRRSWKEFTVAVSLVVEPSHA